MWRSSHKPDDASGEPITRSRSTVLALVALPDTRFPTVYDSEEDASDCFEWLYSTALVQNLMIMMYKSSSEYFLLSLSISAYITPCTLHKELRGISVTSSPK